MDTNSLKRFSTEARIKLKAGVAMMMQQLGFDASGKAIYMLERIGGGALMNGALISDDRFYDRWMSLYHAIQLHGVREVYEEVAYTWFNRFMAIRIMRKNGFISPVLEYQSQDVRIPCIVADARRGVIPPMPEQDRRRLDEILLDDSKTTEQFAILIVAYCHNNPILSSIFGRVNDYTALLLPKSILAPGDFVDMLNNTPFIKNEDYKQSELIGWLYQFYISEKKDEVFAAFKNGSKAEAEDIPAATQIFTPNWIVKYMVQNTLGRIYLDNNPGSPLEERWKYLVPQPESAKDAPKLEIKELEELTLLDPGSGSGHILVEGFDMLYDMYTAEFASPREACEAILSKNITGIDIDTRAKQLAQFSLLMKACQKDDSFLDAKILPRVYDMPEPWENKAGLYELLKKFFARDDRTAIEETTDAITLMDQAKNLGSIMKFGISERTRFQIERRMEESMDEDLERLVPYFNVILALTGKYTAVCANPPYMAYSNMNSELTKYSVQNYPSAKYDLFAIFMLQSVSLLLMNGKMGMISMQSWMFLSAFERLRRNILENYNISTLLHLGPHTFDELSGEVVQNAAFIITHCSPFSGGKYQRLTSGNNCSEKRTLFFNNSLSYTISDQKRFERIPGSPIAYWVGENFISTFNNSKVDDFSEVITGMTIGDNNKYLRMWPEVNFRKLALNYHRMEDVEISKTNWIPYSKGGGRKQWYGNHEYVVNWAKKDNFNRAKTTLSYLYLKEAITWPFITCGLFSARYLPAGSLWDVAGSPCFFEDHNTLLYTLAFLASRVADLYLSILNPTINVQAVDIRNLPLIGAKNIRPNIIKLTESSIQLSQDDWDSHETSWDFKENELVRVYKENHGEGVFMDANRLEDIVTLYKEYWTEKFNQLHANEEELNRQFIEIYGLEDELSPNVPLEEITILQQGEIKIEGDSIVWNDDVIVKQLISYIVGCHMGRYRLDKPGLAIAHPDATDDEKAPYQIPGTPTTFTIDEDALIPLLPAGSGFADNGVLLVCKSIMDILGSKNYAANLNCIETSLGKSLEDYMAKDFWNDHKKMYQNRPIYWLFSSKRGAFKVLAYMHRMTKYTVEQVRQKYLLPYIDKLKGQAEEIQAKGAAASAAERRSLQGLLKNIAECEEYHSRLHTVAEQKISFDLDDGVVKNYALFGDVLAKIK